MSRELLNVVGRNNAFRRGDSAVLESKRYVRALRRRPVAIVHPDGQREILRTSNISDPDVPQSRQRVTPKEQKDSTNKFHLKSSRIISEKHGDVLTTESRNAAQYTAAAAHLKDQLGSLRYERALPGDKRLGKVVSVARSRIYREKQGKVLLEGRRLICDALAAGAVPQMVFFSMVERLSELPLEKLKRASLVKVKFEDINIWSELVTPQGVIAIFSKPDASRLEFPKDLRLQTVPLSLVCDNVRDPGNLGTILRCAAAAGCDRVLLTKGCVDVWEPKVLRAAMGAHFRLPIFPSLSWEAIPEHLPKDVTVHVADNCSTLIRGLQSENPAKSLKPSDLGWVSHTRDQKTRHAEDYSDSDDDTDSSDEEDGSDDLSRPHVEPRVYHDNWACKRTALVIGGETYGLSPEAFELAESTDGNRLFVPVALGMDSLNSAMAASILLFEGRKQLLRLAESANRRAKSEI